MDVLHLLLSGVLFAVLCIVLACFVIYMKARTYPSIVNFESEKFYYDENGKPVEFPSLWEVASCSLSVIVPAYNEEDRLPPMLDECLDYLESKTKHAEAFSYEVIIVDDGSQDKTASVGHKYSNKFGSGKVRVLTLAQNRGKGGAVRLGMFRSRGELLLFADADGATKFADYDKLETSVKKLCEGEGNLSDGLAVSCGSRAHLEEESVATRTYIRTLLMYGFHALVWLFTVRSVRDTQCGFKLMTRRSARILFNSLHIERWAFDAELLYMAEMLGIPIDEVGVNWTEIDGSKVTPIVSWIQMGRDLVIIWLRYTMGAWRIKGDIKI